MGHLLRDEFKVLVLPDALKGFSKQRIAGRDHQPLFRALNAQASSQGLPTGAELGAREAADRESGNKDDLLDRVLGSVRLAEQVGVLAFFGHLLERRERLIERDWERDLGQVLQ